MTTFTSPNMSASVELDFDTDKTVEINITHQWFDACDIAALRKELKKIQRQLESME